MSNLKAIFFDGYGTLLHAPQPYDRMGAELRRVGVEVPLSVVRTALNAEMAWYREHSHTAEDDASLRSLGEECAHVFLRALKGEGMNISLSTDAVIDALMKTYRFELFDDVAPTLRDLRSLGLMLGVVSNWDFRLPAILRDLGVGGEFEFVLTSSSSAPKPDCAMFRDALKRVGVSPSQTWHVGDDLELDVYPAQESGIRPILLHREGKSTCRSSAVVIYSLFELPALARECLQETSPPPLS